MRASKIDGFQIAMIIGLIILLLISCMEDEPNPYNAPDYWASRPFVRCVQKDEEPVTCIYADDECRYEVAKVDGQWVQRSFSCIF